MTFIHFYSAWEENMKGYGYDPKKEFPYIKFTSAWYAYLELLDIDYDEGSNCNQCGEYPDIVICDGTALGFQKRFMNKGEQVESEDEPIIPRYRYFITLLIFRQ